MYMEFIFKLQKWLIVKIAISRRFFIGIDPQIIVASFSCTPLYPIIKASSHQPSQLLLVPFFLGLSPCKELVKLPSQDVSHPPKMLYQFVLLSCIFWCVSEILSFPYGYCEVCPPDPDLLPGFRNPENCISATWSWLLKFRFYLWIMLIRSITKRKNYYKTQ